MQTFLPYADFKKSAKCLDYRRLGKQRVEAKQIINLLEKYDNGVDISKLAWGNHPAVRMWIGYTFRLKLYYNIILNEWIKRGYKNNMELYEFNDFDYREAKVDYPDWLGRKDFHDAHKSKLLLKGEVDALVDNISYEYGKSYKYWYKDKKLPNSKSSITYGMLPILKKLNKGLAYNNHYSKFKWNVPLDLEYKWG